MNKNQIVLKMAGFLLGVMLLGGCAGTYGDAALSATEPAKEPEKSTEETAEEPDAGEAAADADSEQEQSEKKNEPDLKAVLIEESGAKEDDIAFFHKEDFDGDGAEEAFAIIGKRADDYGNFSLVEGEVWFAGAGECRKLGDCDGMGFSDKDRLMVLGNTKYVMFDEIYATGVLTDVWYVSAGKASDASFSGIGEVIHDDYDAEGCFRIRDSSYDCMFDPEVNGTLGHTWKNYYFYYDEADGSVHEFGGAGIDTKKAQELSGRDLVKELIPAGAAVDSIYYRDNKQIVINYENKEDEYTYFYHYIFDLERDCLIDDTSEETGEEPLEGICLKALCPDMAVCPKVE